MVQSYSEGSLNHFSKPVIFSHLGLSLLLEFLGQKIDLYCKTLFVLWSFEVRNRELNLSLLRPVRFGWSPWAKKEDGGVFHGGAARSQSAAFCLSLSCCLFCFE